MPKFSVNVPNPLGREQGVEKLRNMMDKIAEAYSNQLKDLQQEWDDNTLSFSFRTMGLSISGKTVVEDEQVSVNGDLPIAAMMFKGKIENDIRTQLEKLLQ